MCAFPYVMLHSIKLNRFRKKLTFIECLLWARQCTLLHSIQHGESMREGLSFIPSTFQTRESESLLQAHTASYIAELGFALVSRSFLTTLQKVKVHGFL